MKIIKISCYQVALPLKEGSYTWANQSFPSFDSTILVIDTDEGVQGVGEVCPLGPAYLPAYAEGAREGMKLIAQSLIGQDPCQIGQINLLMDQCLKGHPYVKSAIDMACWDIYGKALNQPLCNLIGGRLQDQVQLFKVVSRAEPEKMVEKLVGYQEQGFTQFQMKVGENADRDIERMHKISAALWNGNVLAADANCGWKQHEAIKVVQAIRDLSLYIEQPCTTYEECLAVREHCNQPMILDECMDSLATLVRGYNDRAMDLVNLKISRIGGISKAKLFRDLCVELGIALTIEDTWGGEVVTAAIAHLGHSTAPGFHFQSSPFHEYHSLAIAEGGPEIADGKMWMSDQPGLGVELNWDLFKTPMWQV